MLLLLTTYCYENNTEQMRWNELETCIHLPDEGNEPLYEF